MIGNYYLLIAVFGKRVRKRPLGKSLEDDVGVDSWIRMKRHMDK